MEVLAVGDDIAPPLGASDSDILAWIEREGYILVSRNRRSLPLHLSRHLDSGGHVPGIFLLRPRASLKEIIEDLLLIWEAAEMEEFKDQIVYLPL